MAANVMATMGEDVKKVATKIDVIDQEVLDTTNSRVDRVEGAIQEHAKKFQQMD